MYRKITLAAILAVAALLRLYHLGHHSFWFDELGQGLVAQGGLWQAITGAGAHRGAAPLDYVITHFMLYIGHGDAILRLPAALFGVASVWLLYLLGRALASETVGLLAAALLTIAPLHIYYSQEMRFYSLATFMILVTVYTFVRAKSRLDWLVFGVVAALALYSHYYTLLVLAALALWALLWRRSQLLLFVLSSAVAVLLFAPWLWYDVVRPGTPNSNPAEFVAPSVDVAIAGLFGLVAEEGCYWKCQTGIAFFVVVLLLGAWRAPLPLLVAVVGIAGVFALNVYGQYFYAARQLLVFLPFVLLLLAATVAILPRYQVPAAIVAFALAALLFVPRIVEMHSAPPTADWRAAALYLLKQQGGDAVIMTNVPAYLQWYAPNLEVVPVTRDSALATFETLQAEGKTVWFVPYGDSGRRLFAAIFDKYQRQRHPTHRPIIYAIPHPGEW